MSTSPVLQPSVVDTSWLTEQARSLVTNVSRVVRGRDEAVRLVVVAVLSGGHALIEDTPGSGKTTIARAVARSVAGRFQRIQGTPDLLPTDITGSTVWDQGRHEFVFVAGPVFAHVLLLDEVNRTPPRTQSALFEAMDEGAATVDGVRHRMPEPFFVVATQNPVEQHGTYPLPEGQLDRFAVRVRLGPLDPAAELLVVREQLVRATVEDLLPVLSASDLLAVQHGVRGLHVGEPVLRYALALVHATRDEPRVVLGASSRAAICLVRVAQAHAVLAGREYVMPDDVQRSAVPVLAHRLRLAHVGDSAEALVAGIVAATPVPVSR